MPGSRAGTLVHHSVHIGGQKVSEKESGITKPDFKKDQPEKYIENGAEKWEKVWIKMVAKTEENIIWKTLHKKNWKSIVTEQCNSVNKGLTEYMPDIVLATCRSPVNKINRILHGTLILVGKMDNKLT